jgi:hypothetical protein
MTYRDRRSPTIAAALAAAALLSSALPASAHHSNAVFDSTQTISLEGAVTRYEWANPHVYLWIAVAGANGEKVEWEVEGQPPAMLRRLGWSQATLGMGDAVQVTGNPSRDRNRNKVLLVSLKRADATLYDGKSFMTALTTPVAAPAAAARGIGGVWTTQLDLAAMQAYLDPSQRVALTEHGAAAKASYDEATMSSGLKCVATPAPAFMFVPDIKRVTVEADSIRIAGEFGAAERVIHLGVAASAPLAARTPSVQGYSVGRWEGATLVVETTDFARHSGGIGFSLPSSAKKRLVERLTLEEDGRSLAYAFEVTDPEMLSAPITGASRWVYSPDVEFAPAACDLDNARRFTQ